MQRNAADNEYLHKDFHGALSGGLDYLKENYGPDAVIEYLQEFTDNYFGPLKEKLRSEGLMAVKDHFEKIYQIERGQADFELSDDELLITVAQCPAVMHMRSQNYQISDMWVETTRTVNERLCEGSDYSFDLEKYDPQTGASVQRFYRTEVQK